MPQLLKFSGAAAMVNEILVALSTEERRALSWALWLGNGMLLASVGLSQRQHRSLCCRHLQR